MYDHTVARFPAVLNIALNRSETYINHNDHNASMKPVLLHAVIEIVSSPDLVVQLSWST